MRVQTFRAASSSEALARVRRELGAAARILETRRIAGEVEVVAAADPSPAISATSDRTSEIDRLRAVLSERGFAPELIGRLIRAVVERLDADALADSAAVQMCARELIALWLPAAPQPAPRASRVFVIVGPAGVGKTTTIAKLAAHEIALRRRRVVLASADDRRLGGAEQLRAYARIFRAPFHVLRTARDLSRARRDAGADGVVFVDTPGVARDDVRTVRRLRGILAGVGGAEVELLLAADREPASLADALERFAALQPSAIGVTRTDEAVLPGRLLSVLADARIPLRHVCGGPSVPEDIAAADARVLAEWALPEDAPVACAGDGDAP